MVLLVEVRDQRITKPYLGGWRHTVTGVIYHNAESQTGPLEKSNVGSLCSREVQCIDIRHNACQTTVNVATQMSRKDCYISSECDKYLTAKFYETYEEREKRIDLNGKANIIQKFYRSWRMMKNLKNCATAYMKNLEDCEKFRVEQAELYRKRNELAIIRLTSPYCRSDFTMIYASIESWKNSRLLLIQRNLFDDSRIAENYRILEETVEMLKNIDKHRMYIVEEYRSKQLESFLNHHCKAVRWKSYRGSKPIEMVTLRVEKARKLKCLHERLKNTNCTVDGRIQLLILLKRSLSFHHCCPAIELEDLIDQELILLSRAIKGLCLKYLRGRISLAFLYFIRHSHDCCINDENSSDMELFEPFEEKSLCHSCQRLLPREKFEARTRMKKISYCQGCAWLREQTIEKVDYDPYTYLLNGIRADEYRRNCFSTLLYVIQEPEIYHLVKNIWHGRSIISEVSDVFHLRLVRFNTTEDWSPWNCILLTDDEAEVHYYLENFSAVYSKSLLDRIQLLHMTARRHFQELIRLEKKFKSSSHYRMAIQERIHQSVTL